MLNIQQYKLDMERGTLTGPQIRELYRPVHEGAGDMNKFTVYGFFPGGDPRDFTSDPECSTEQERQLHQEHCAAWDRGECPEVKISGFVSPDIHVTRSVYGLGTYTVDWDDEGAA